MKKSILAVCDSEPDYASHFLDYMNRDGGKGTGFPFEIAAFSDTEALERYCGENRVQFLLISQSMYEQGRPWRAEQVMILSEDGEGPPGSGRIGKYQSIEGIMRKVLEAAADTGLLPPAPCGDGQSRMNLIGVYSPVGRCLQTTFSFTMGQLLARRHKVLYLNFECCSGLGRMLQRDFQSDLSDLIYLLHNQDGRFPYRLEGMAQKVNGLDMIPPVYSSLDLQQVGREEWLELLQELEKAGSYDYVILDLSEAVQGLFDILKRCRRVYTIVREDSFALAKQEQYEELLGRLSYEAVLEKTRKCKLPLFRQLPSNLELMTHGELAGLVQKLIEEDLGGSVS